MAAPRRRHRDSTADPLHLLEQQRHGIADGQLRLHYQPRVCLPTGRVDGVEALVRWQHPVRGLLPPGEFIAVAEQSGLVRELGSWVLEEAIAQTVRWAVEPDDVPVQMAVNLSARQLADPHLVTLVATAHARHGLKASHLVLEITETALMSEPATAPATLTALKTLGVGLKRPRRFNFLPLLKSQRREYRDCSRRRVPSMPMAFCTGTLNNSNILACSDGTGL